MSFATGPWHTPPNLPDDPVEFCLALLFREGRYPRYAVLRYTRQWLQQNGEPLEAGTSVSRWAYIASSIERLSELPPPRYLPTGSRLFVADALTDAERVRLLAAYVTELKGDVARLQDQLERTPGQGSGTERLDRELRVKEHELMAKLASTTKRYEDQRTKLVALHEEMQKLAAALAKRPTPEQMKERAEEYEKRIATQRAELATLKKVLERALQQDKEHLKDANQAVALRDKKIHDQRKTLVDLEAQLARLKERLKQGAPANS